MKMRNDLTATYAIDCVWRSAFAQAYGYGPFSGFNEFESLHPTFRERQKKYWAEFNIDPGLSISSSGRVWPDFLPCGNPPFPYFVSQRVVDSFVAHGIGFARAKPVPLGKIEGKRLSEALAPAYYAIEALPGILIDYHVSGFTTDADGNPNLPVGKEVIVQLDPRSWSGAPLFRCGNWPRGGKELLCTEEVKKIAEMEGWTNVGFVRQRLKGVDPFTGQPIRS